MDFLSQTGGVDLHCHTTASDGDLTPTELVRAAVEAGLEGVGITDHDTVGGIAEALEAAHGIEVIPAVEISCDVRTGSFHVLGFCIDHRSPFLAEPLEYLRKRRTSRAAEIVAKLASVGLEIDLPARATGHSVGRPHIAEALIAAGHAGSRQEAFDRFIGVGCPGYVPSPRLLPCEAFEMIIRAGGVPVLAHPHTFDNETMIGVYAKEGLCGLESDYGVYDLPTRKRWRRVAERLGLLTTGGSDFHGNTRPERRLGSVRFERSILDRLRAKRRVI
jgi:hypothetical protein